MLQFVDRKPLYTCMLLILMISSAAGRGGAAPAAGGAVDGHVHDQRVRGGVGAGGRLRLRRLGQHDQLRAPDRHLRPLHQVLPVPAAAPPAGSAAAVPRRLRQHHDDAVRRRAPAGRGSFAGALSPPPPAPQPWALKGRTTISRTAAAGA